MCVKTDRWIIEQVEKSGFIRPFQQEAMRDGVVSYGVSSMGYDFRLDDVFRTTFAQHAIDVLNQNRDLESVRSHEQHLTQWMLLPSQMVLAKSLEYFKMPDNMLGIVTGKSTYARCGVLLNCTPIEPGWEGFITLSIANIGHNPVLLHAYQGIGQICFYEADEVPLITYATKQGKYQAAQGIQAAIVEGRNAAA